MMILLSILLANLAFAVDGFKIDSRFTLTEFAKVDFARSMAVSSDGHVFVGNRKADSVYVVKDIDGDGRAEFKKELFSNLRMPNGVALQNGHLYIGENHRIIKVNNILKNIKKDPPYSVVFDSLPKETHHGWRYIGFGPDEKLYVSLGAPCNVCLKGSDNYATIVRYDLKTKYREVVARGVRNSVGFNWNPIDNSFWFTDNGRDWMGDDSPSDELNKLSAVGEHFGFPFVHGKSTKDPKYFKKMGTIKSSSPVVELGAHVASLGMLFPGHSLGNEFKNGVFVALHGSWNRTRKSGYSIVFIDLKKRPYRIEKIVDTKSGEKTLGRPVDIKLYKGNSILFSDDYNGKIYKLDLKK